MGKKGMKVENSFTRDIKPFQMSADALYQTEIIKFFLDGDEEARKRALVLKQDKDINQLLAESLKAGIESAERNAKVFRRMLDQWIALS